MLRAIVEEIFALVAIGLFVANLLAWAIILGQCPSF